MNNILTNKYLILLIRIVLAVIFIFSGIEKISNPSGFSEAISNYRLFPLFSVNLIAISLPWIELVVGLLLLVGIKIKENVLIINFLMSFFILIVFIALVRGLDINCGCFGTVNSQKVGIFKIIENIFLLVGGILVYKSNIIHLTIFDK